MSIVPPSTNQTTTSSIYGSNSQSATSGSVSGPSIVLFSSHEPLFSSPASHMVSTQSPCTIEDTRECCSPCLSLVFTAGSGMPVVEREGATLTAEVISHLHWHPHSVRTQLYPTSRICTTCVYGSQQIRGIGSSNLPCHILSTASAQASCHQIVFVGRPAIPAFPPCMLRNVGTTSQGAPLPVPPRRLVSAR